MPFQVCSHCVHRLHSTNKSTHTIPWIHFELLFLAIALQKFLLILLLKFCLCLKQKSYVLFQPQLNTHFRIMVVVIIILRLGYYHFNIQYFPLTSFNSSLFFKQNKCLTCLMYIVFLVSICYGHFPSLTFTAIW